LVWHWRAESRRATYLVKGTKRDYFWLLFFKTSSQAPFRVILRLRGRVRQNLLRPKFSFYVALLLDFSFSEGHSVRGAVFSQPFFSDGGLSLPPQETSLLLAPGGKGPAGLVLCSAFPFFSVSSRGGSPFKSGPFVFFSKSIRLFPKFFFGTFFCRFFPPKPFSPCWREAFWTDFFRKLDFRFFFISVVFSILSLVCLA